MNRTLFMMITCTLGLATLTLAGCEPQTPQTTDESPGATDAGAETERFVVRLGADPAELGTTDRVHTCQGVLLASQPAAADFQLLAERDYRSVLNLRSQPEMEQLGFDEPALLEEQGLRYYQVEVAGAEGLTDEALDRTREILNDNENHPIMVHCASANRVGAVWLAHRVIDHGVDYEAALEEAKTIGLRSDALEERARDYIERHRG